MRILVLGVTGMLGSAVFRTMSDDAHHEVWGTVRDSGKVQGLGVDDVSGILQGVNVLDPDSLALVFRNLKPDVVINCVGLIKQGSDAGNPLIALPLNSLLPHRLANLCDLSAARLIHMSTDCVFSGDKGLYQETDRSDARDLYGKSKYIGEVSDRECAITLRTSIIGHELRTRLSLLDWFLGQDEVVNGYSRAIFSGLPTNELARVIRDLVIPNTSLSGLYHVSSDPISKFDLLRLVAERYAKDVEIVEDRSVVIDRSLVSERFRSATGYEPPSWPDLIEGMWQFRFGAS